MKMSYTEYRRAVEIELGHTLESWEAGIVADCYAHGDSVAECVARF